MSTLADSINGTLEAFAGKTHISVYLIDVVPTKNIGTKQIKRENATLTPNENPSMVLPSGVFSPIIRESIIIKYTTSKHFAMSLIHK